MPGYLLDSHTLLWYLDGDSQISKRALDVILHPNSQCYVSYISLYELGIKINKRQLEIDTDISLLAKRIRLNSIELIPLQISHITEFAKLHKPTKHKDPFDRMLVAQAMSEGLTLITRDEALRQYPIEVLW